MSSYFEQQRNNFKASLASASGRINVRAQGVVSVATAPPSPSPSILSASSKVEAGGKKRKRDTSGIVYSQPELTGYGTEVNTHVTFVLVYLKNKRGEVKTLGELLDHLSVDRAPDSHKEALVRAIRLNPRILWAPDLSLAEQHWSSGTYSHRPIIPGVKDRTSLLALLQSSTDASGVSIKDLKDGWPDCEPDLAALEAEHRIRVVRNKKDSRVWLDDPSLCYNVDQDFRNLWLRISIPPADEIVRRLLAYGLKPASEDPRRKAAQAAARPKQKKRSTRKSGKSTNTHMEHLLKDYSHLTR